MKSFHFCLAATLIMVTHAGIAATPAPAKPQEIFYRTGAGKTTQLVAAARDGTNVSSLFTDSGTLFFSFDVGSADSGSIVVGTRSGELQLVTYAKNSSGVFSRTGVTTLLTGIPQGTAVALSPDGTRIAYRGGDGTHLMVYTIADRTNAEWSVGPWAWDFAWARGGGSIALLEQSNPIDGRSHLYEVTGPGQRSDILNLRKIDTVETSHTDGDVLLLSYNSEDGQQTLVGTWRLPSATVLGGWVSPRLAGRTVANRGVLSCDDGYLIYGSSGSAGQQTWYTRTLPSGSDLLMSKVGANAIPRSWSACPTAITTNAAFQFRVVPQ